MPPSRLSDTLIGTFTDPAVTNLTDTGLSIGTTYYYKVFTVDTNDTYSPSNERSTTTVPVTWPLADAMETTDQWVTTGAWGIAPNGRSGGCLSDSPVGDYANSTDSYALTRGESDRDDLAGVEVLGPAPDGGQRLGAAGDLDRRQQLDAALRQRRASAPSGRSRRIDLSPWKNQSNLRIRFHLWTDGGTTEDGWSIDDLEVDGTHAGGYFVPVLRRRLSRG